MSADGNDTPRDPWRPSKYDPAFCESVLAMGAEGKSKVEIAHELRVGRTTIQRWEADHEDFRVAMAHAKQAEQAWWERQGRENLKADRFQASMWSRSMAARFPDDWRERTDNTTTLKAGGELAGLLAKIAMKSVYPKDDEQN